jgi:hypothetical protein
MQISAPGSWSVADGPKWIVASELGAGGEHVDVCAMTLPRKLSPSPDWKRPGMESSNGTEVVREENTVRFKLRDYDLDNACSHQSAITFVKSDLEGNILSAQYSEEEMIPPPVPLRRLGSIGGIQTFG